MQRKICAVQIRKAGAMDGTALYRATISTDSVDSDGEVLIPRGCDFQDFEKRPTVFWNHDYNRPVGKAIAVRKTDHAVVSDFIFAERPRDHEGEWFPGTAEALVDQGVVRTVSVGLDRLRSFPAGVAEKMRYGPDVRFVTPEWKLLEWSIAPVPSNADALIELVHKGRMTPEVYKSVTGLVYREPALVLTGRMPDGRPRYFLCG